MSNSELVEYTLISPNKTSPRNHVIDTITIHCTAGQVTAESLGNIFFPASRKASSNYGIDKDGRVGLYVDEADRSWCSSNRENDMRAVTIEVSSDNKDPYKVNDVAFNKLIDLVTDICIRNKIEKLVWSGNKEDRIYHKNNCNMTVHRDYANKACPGDYLYNRMGEIANLVNNRLQGDKQMSKIESTMTVKEIYDWLKNCDLTDAGVSGLLGNIKAESGIRSNNLQNGFETKLGLTDKQYTDMVNNGTYSKTQFVNDSAGYGLCQWTYWSRKLGLYEYAESINHNIDSVEMQLKYLLQELNTRYKSVYEVLKTSNDIKKCSDTVLTQFEKPQDQSDKVKDKRYEYSKEIFDTYSNSSTDSTGSDTSFVCPCRVRVEINNLNIRSEASKNSQAVGKCPIGVFTILEVKQGYGSKIGWGRLKSGIGWISLDYVKKC